MRLFIEPEELLFLDGLLQNLIIERDVAPAAYALAGKVKKLISQLVEAMPDEPPSP